MYTLVQHSGVTTGHPEFEKGLEPRAIDGKADTDRVRAAGGIVVDDYTEADALADALMYPEGHTGLLPAAAGTFSDVTIDGLPVYVPIRETKVIG